MSVIRALAFVTNVSGSADVARVVEKLEDLGFKDWDRETTARVLEAAREFTQDAYVDAKLSKSNPYEHGRSTYLPIIHALDRLAGLHARGACADLKRRLARRGFKADLASPNPIRDLLREAREFTP